MSRKGQISLRGQKYLERLFCLCQRRTDCAAAVEGIWKGDLVVRFLPLSFYAKKKVAERKARIRGGGAKDARMREHMVAPVPPLMYPPL